jgi:signal transduction histidine kinase
MRERAVFVGAALAIKPAQTGGVEVRLEVPAVTGNT